MAITGRFLADFTSFQDAVSKAEVSLKKMESGAGSAAKGLDKMVDTLSGRTLIRDATLAAEAVERIGGASKLTDEELKKLGTTADRAIAKLKAMGEEIPPGLEKISTAAKNIKPPIDQAQNSLTSMLGSLSKVAGALGIAFSAQALVGFVGKVFDAASQVKDLSDRLGVSTDAVQRFKYAAEQGGGTIDDVGASIAKMNQNLAEGSKDTHEALKLLGLGFAEVRRQSPEDAFLGITDKLKGIEDPMQRTRLQMELFGKGSAGLGAQIAGGFREAADAADIMSAQTIKDLEAAQQAWENLANKVVIVSGNIIAGTLRTVNEVTSTWQRFMVFASNATTMGVGVAASLASATSEARNTETAIAKVNTQIGRSKVQIDAAAAAAKALAAELKQIKAEDAKRIADGYADMVEVFKKANAMAAVAMQGFTNDLDKVGTKVAISQDTFFQWLKTVREGIPVVAGLGSAFGQLGTLITPIPPKIEKVKVNLGDLSKALAELATVSGSTFSAMVSGLSTLVGAANTASESIKSIKTAQKAFEKGKDMEGILGMASGIAGIVTAALAAVNAIKAIWSAFDRNKGRDLVEDFAGTFGGFDQLHAKLLELGEAGEALWVKLTQGVGRNNPEQAERVIAEVEAALARQAEAQDEVTSATEEQAQATIETASQAAKALDELGPRLKENERQWQDWGQIVTAQIQAIANAVRAMPLPGSAGAPPLAGVPGARLGPAPAPAGGSDEGGRTTTLVVEFDGRQIAAAAVPWLPGEVQRFVAT